MLNIVFTRIDDRLIHGQVATAWSKVTNANRIIVVDDVVSKDSFMDMVLKSAAPKGINVDVFSVEDAVPVINGDDTGENVFILAKTPDTILKLINLGVNLKALNLGGMGAKIGRKQFYKNILYHFLAQYRYIALQRLDVWQLAQIVYYHQIDRL